MGDMLISRLETKQSQQRH